MALKILSALYVAAALFGGLVLVANAKEMFFASGAKLAGYAWAAHGLVTVATIAACGISGWFAPSLTVLLAWSVALVASGGRLIGWALQGGIPCVRCLAVSTAIQGGAALAVTLAAR